VIGRTSVSSPVEFEVKEVHRENINRPNDPFNITIVLQADDPFISGPSMVVTFGAGSLLFQPVPAPPDVDPPRSYLSLIPPAAERILRQTGGAMTGTACDVKAFGSATQVPVEDPAGRLRSHVRPHLVGAYFGGATYACGVLHPAGMCLMRDDKADPTLTGELKVPQGVSKVCVVCRYVMVDFVDPHQHWRLDKDYAEWFPF
jgi:hypothetical protein